MSSEKLEVGDVVEVVYRCLSFGKVGRIIGCSPYLIEFFDGGFKPFGMHSSLKYLGPSVSAEEVLGLDYFT